MKLGLLVCDAPAPEVADVAGTYVEMFERTFGVEGITFEPFAVHDGRFPQSISEFDGWMTTGSQASTYDDAPWIGELERFVAEAVVAEQRYVGICFGHQMMAQALGGKVARAEVGWGVGLRRFQSVSGSAWNPENDSFGVIVSHRDQVIELPSDAVVAAEARYCPVGAFTVGARALGVQGHPEFNAAYSAALMRMRAGIIPAETAATAMSSLDRDVDSAHQRLTHDIATFLRS